jgi:hypothetical protein
MDTSQVRARLESCHGQSYGWALCCCSRDPAQAEDQPEPNLDHDERQALFRQALAALSAGRGSRVAAVSQL